MSEDMAAAMAAAHKRDSNDQQRMQDMSRTIAAFLNDPPRRANPTAKTYLVRAQLELDRACAHLVAVWD